MSAELKPISTPELVDLIRKSAAEIDTGNADQIRSALAALREVVAPCCHEGKGDEMNASDAGFRMQLEWFAGQILEIFDNSHLFAVNSWLNCTEKFTTRSGL